jgi:hypothetical protein
MSKLRYLQMSKLRYLMVPSIVASAFLVAHDVSTSLWYEQLWWSFHYH